MPEKLRHRPSLGKAQALRLARLGRRIEALFQQPMDIEWCRTDAELFILQARPVTTGRRADPWNDTYRGDFLWTNTNVGEAIPDVMTPATWSMVQVFLNDAMATASIPPYVGYGRIGGHIYLNVSVMKTLSGIVGVNERNFRALTEEVFGHLPDDVEIPPVPASWAKVMRSVVPVALHVLSEAHRDVRKLDDYLATHPALCLRRRREIAEVDDPETLADAVDLDPGAGVPPGQQDAVRGHPQQWCVLRHHPQATAGDGRTGRGQRGHRRSGRRRDSWPAWTCSRASTSSTPARSTRTPSTSGTATADRTSSRSRAPGRARTRSGWRASGRSASPGDRRGADGEATEAGAGPGARLDQARPPVPRCRPGCCDVRSGSGGGSLATASSPAAR